MNQPNTTRSRRASRRFLRGVQRPWVTLVFLAAVLIDLFTLAPGYQYRQGGSLVANAIGSLREPELRQATPPTREPRAYVAWYSDTNELRQVDRGRRRDDGWKIFYDVYSSFTAEYSGWWGLTEERRGFGWTFDESGRPGTAAIGSPSPPSLDRVNQAFVESITASGDSFWIEEAERAVNAPGGAWYQETRVRWQGWVRNGSSLMLWALLLFSSLWIWREWRDRVWWRRLARRVCPDCGYELGSIDNRAPCPECGRAHPPRPPEVFGAPGLATRVWRVRTPIGSLCLLGLLVGDVLLLPKGKHGHGSWVANRLPTPAIRTDEGDGRPVETIYLAVLVENGAAVFKVVGSKWPDGKNGEPGPAWNSEEVLVLADGERRPMKEIVVAASITRDSHTKGFWAPVRRYVYCNHGGWGWDGLPEEIRKNFNERMIAWFDSAGMPQWAADLRLRQIHAGYHDSTIWMGHAHNAAAMGVGLVIVCSLGWIPSRLLRLWAPRASEHGRCAYCLALRTERGRCTVCGEPGEAEEGAT